mmetsp:Transcript_21106/g.47337  ORF Transcript_21106/g.47337 Transcript_21106/m.47337 type:complete len:85 (-) Transcript_21106:426-680(-)
MRMRAQLDASGRWRTFSKRLVAWLEGPPQAAPVLAQAAPLQAVECHVVETFHLQAFFRVSLLLTLQGNLRAQMALLQLLTSHKA